MRKKFVVCIAALFCFSVTLPAQIVSNVQFEQVDNKVKITYLLDKQADISVSVSENGGKTWSLPLTQVSGGVGSNTQAGYNTIWWDALAEFEQIVGACICFKVYVPNTQCNAIIAEKDGMNLTITINNYTFTMVYVEGGTFIMGATSEQRSSAKWEEKPAHSVTLSDYYIGKFEVTQGLWQAVMGHNPTRFKGERYPEVNIDWDDCQQFINVLNNLLFAQLDGKRFALPTEAQWEYAARGGNKSIGYKYAGSNRRSSVARSNKYERYQVGQMLPNELGLYDMSGNVREWCHDWYGNYSASAQTNPQGRSLGTYRVDRGGSIYFSEGKFCRVSYRGYASPSHRSLDRGMRLVLIL